MIQRLKFLIYAIVLSLATRKQRSKSKKVLIVKTDEIGDYVLWRNCAPFFRSSKRFNGYSLSFCGNSAWKSLTDKFDNDLFDDYIWIDKKKFKSDMRYRYRFLRNINRQGFEIVINVIYSRSLLPDDSIVKAAAANHNIGMIANENNIAPFEKGYDKNLYHELIDLSSDSMFDFSRNKLFTEKVTGVKIDHLPLRFDTSSFERSPSLPEKYFVVFPGSNHVSKKWQTANFVETASFIHKEYNYHAVVCGSAMDLPYTKAFAEAYPYPYTDLTCKTSLPVFLEVLAYAKCLVSVDTSAVHLAAAVNCIVYGVFNGSLYGRFAPYPKDVNKNVFALYPDIVDKEIAESSTPPDRYRYQSNISYNEVTPAKVISVIKKTLPQP